jgi:hypothetical protein
MLKRKTSFLLIRYDNKLDKRLIIVIVSEELF